MAMEVSRARQMRIFMPDVHAGISAVIKTEISPAGSAVLSSAVISAKTIPPGSVTG